MGMPTILNSELNYNFFQYLPILKKNKLLPYLMSFSMFRDLKDPFCNDPLEISVVDPDPEPDP
jgi:hypothetical protein